MKMQKSQKTSKLTKPKRRFRLKVILLGDSGVGKTFLYTRFITQKIPDLCAPTLGMDFFTRKISLEEENLDFNLDIWDTAGHEKFRAVNRSYYKEADLIFFVYDITDTRTFQNLEHWLDDYYENGNKDSPLILVGNFLLLYLSFLTYLV